MRAVLRFHGKGNTRSTVRAREKPSCGRVGALRVVPAETPSLAGKQRRFRLAAADGPAYAASERRQAPEILGIGLRCFAVLHGLPRGLVLRLDAGELDLDRVAENLSVRVSR